VLSLTFLFLCPVLLEPGSRDIAGTAPGCGYCYLCIAQVHPQVYDLGVTLGVTVSGSYLGSYCLREPVEEGSARIYLRVSELNWGIHLWWYLGLVTCNLGRGPQGSALGLFWGFPLGVDMGRAGRMCTVGTRRSQGAGVTPSPGTFCQMFSPPFSWNNC
jgi:hypothetical protein